MYHTGRVTVALDSSIYRDTSLSSHEKPPTAEARTDRLDGPLMPVVSCWERPLGDSVNYCRRSLKGSDIFNLNRVFLNGNADPAQIGILVGNDDKKGFTTDGGK